MEQKEIMIRRVNALDIDALLKLYDIVWPNVDYDKHAKARFMLEYSTGVGYGAECKGKMIGSHLSIYQNFYVGDRKIKCVETGDTCVDPCSQGLGLFQKIYCAFRRDFFDNEKGDLIWGISAPGAVRSFTKAGKQFIDTTMKLRHFSQPMRTLWKIKGDIRELRKPIIWDKISESYDIDELLLEKRESLLNTSQLLHLRYDKETFAWRLKSDSGIKCFLVQDLGMILYKIGRRGKIVEIGIGEVFLYDYTISSFKRLYRYFKSKLHPDIVWVIVSKGHPLCNIYSKAGFITNPKKKFLPHCVLLNQTK